jgi:hypothetical protein
MAWIIRAGKRDALAMLLLLLVVLLALGHTIATVRSVRNQVFINESLITTLVERRQGHVDIMEENNKMLKEILAILKEKKQ